VDRQAKDTPIRLIQLTDTHLSEDSGEQLLGLDTRESLCDVLDLVNAIETNPDHLVVTGDVGGVGEPGSYQCLLDLLAQHLPLPMNWLPGNHDGPADMLTACPSACERVVELGDWLLVLLDTSVAGHVHGHLKARELQSLGATLARYPDRPTLVFMHHHPVPLDIRWLDGTQLDNADELFALLALHKQVKALSWGHVHQEFNGVKDGIQLIASPSTCIQFAPQRDDFCLDKKMPGYRWYDLHSDGRFETGVHRVADKPYGIDYDSSGY